MTKDTMSAEKKIITKLWYATTQKQVTNFRGLYSYWMPVQRKKQIELQWQHISQFFFGLQKLQLKLLVPTMQKDQQSSNFSAHYQSHKNKQLPYKNIQ